MEAVNKRALSRTIKYGVGVLTSFEVTPGTCALADWVLWIEVGSEPLRAAPFQIQSTKGLYTKFLAKFKSSVYILSVFRLNIIQF